MIKTTLHRLLLLLATLSLVATAAVGCGGDDGDANADASDIAGGDTAGGDANPDSTGDDTTPGDLVVPETYTFESALAPGEDNVSYGGQIARQVLIADLGGYMEGLSEQIDTGTFMPASDGEVVAALDYYLRFDSDAYGDEPFALATDPAPLQSTWNEISSGKNLIDKLAGNDTSTDHKDWSSAFSGWSDETIAQHGGSVTSPEGFVVALFETLEENAIAQANGTLRQGPGGETLPAHITESGIDLAELTAKFLLGAVNFSQGADDYLDDDIDGKGILSDNTALVDGKPYTQLEHHWDEGFGYFGGARDLHLYTPDDVARRYRDSNGDGAIDLTAEYNFAFARYAMSRDGAAVVATDYVAQIMDGFRTGRAIITNAAGRALTDEELTELKAQRDKAVLAWEAVIAANIVHYLNDTLAHMADFDTADYDFAAHAAHWSEMKGFALGLQFNPHSALSDEDYTELHALLGDAPVLATADSEAIAAYKADLLAARELLGNAYGFDAANLGDDNGEGGW